MKIYDPNEVINEGTGARGSLRLHSPTQDRLFSTLEH